MFGTKKGTRKPPAKKPLSNGWIVVPSKTYPDRVYFYNTVTRCSTWNNPCEDTSDVEVNNSSPETSSSEGNLAFKTKHQSNVKSQSKRHKSQPILNSPDRNCNIRVNSEIEDYDDLDEYFTNSSKTLSQSHLISPSNSPNSVSSSKVNQSDSDMYSDLNECLENNEKQLWVYFESNKGKPNVKNSLAFSDFQEPSTSQNSRVEKIDESAKNKNDSVFRPKNIKKKKKKFDSKKKCDFKKTNKNVSLRRIDKTPAQTRLLKLRKQTAERLKALAAKYPELGVSNIGDVSSNKEKHPVAFDMERQTENDKSSGGYLKSNDTFCGTIQEPDNYLVDDYTEEMDWEPSSEESDVRNINVFRQQLDKPKEILSDFFQLKTNQSSMLPSKTHSWFLILDTNIFVSCLSFIKELRDTRVPDLGSPVIYVPWRVLQELDHLKSSNAVDKSLHKNVRRAISYLNDNFKLGHPRIFGQSFEDFSKMVDINSLAPDDEILQTCIKLQKQHGVKRLMLLTNDKNLESKAIVSGVEVYSKDRFQKKYLKPDSSLIFTNTFNKSTNVQTIADDSLCEVKKILKQFLSIVVETELRIAFEGDWIKVAVKKPPWSLQDVMQCLLKHWRSVFFLIFSKDTHSEAELLNERLFKTEAATAEEVTDIIRITQRLIKSIEKSQKNKRPYLDLIPDIVARLSSLLKTSPNPSPRVKISLPSTSLPSELLDCEPHFNSQQISQNETFGNDALKVQALFKDIWDYLRTFCCSVCDIINSSCVSTNPALQEVKLKLPQILKEFQELVATIEKALEINPPDVNENHPVIVHFSNFLLHVYPDLVSSLKNDLPKCLATFFTNFIGRSLLSSALKDFKEFILDLFKAAEYLNGQYT